MYHCLICRKKSCKKIPEYDKWFNKDQTAHNREDQTYPQDFSASAKLPGRVILAGKGGSCLTESSNHVIGKIFKVHGNGTACNCRRAKAVHRGLYKDIGKAEYSTLDGRRDSHFKNCTYRSGIKITFMKCKWKRRSILLKEALRVVKKGGAFSFQDMFSQKALYGDMDEFVRILKAEGISEVHYIGNLEKKLEFIPGFVTTPWMIRGMGILYGKK